MANFAIFCFYIIMFIFSDLNVNGFRTLFANLSGTNRKQQLTLSINQYSIADQPLRYAQALSEKNDRILNIDKFYDPSFVKGKTVLVTGGNRGIGLALANELISQGAKVIVTTRNQAALTAGIQVIDGIDVTDNQAGEKLSQKLQSQNIDVLINNAGYFYGPMETLESLNFEEEKKMIDICAIGPLRITAALVNRRHLQEGAKVVIISSQGGSIAWRFTQNPNGQDYGHHMSKAAANMAGVLLAQELKAKKISVRLLHPGFNKTDMTKKYEKIWEVEGAVDVTVGAKRIIHEIGLQNLENTGSFVNCEDGKLIPW